MTRLAPVAVLSLVALLACGGGEAPAPAGDEAETGEAPADTPEATAPETAGDEALGAEPAQLRTVSVEIYFPAVDDDGLVGEFREIFDTAQAGDRVKQIVADLISGPTGDRCTRAVSPGTRLRQVYVLADGTAYLDFSAELTEGIGGGSMKELLTVYAIVDSIAFNVGEVHRVAILVNGRPIETMNGHLDLRRPLKPNASWILGGKAARAGVPRGAAG